jgi:ferredoxin
MKITQKHNDCIGCGACTAVCPDFWEMGNDGKAHLKGGDLDGGIYSLEVDKKKVGCNFDAKDVCPVQVISVE